MNDNLNKDTLGDIITLVNGESSEGKKRWAYLSIKPSMYFTYMQALQGEGLDISKFGEILASGEGDEPPAEVKAEMREKHGADENFEAVLARVFTEVFSD